MGSASASELKSSLPEPKKWLCCFDTMISLEDTLGKKAIRKNRIFPCDISYRPLRETLYAARLLQKLL